METITDRSGRKTYIHLPMPDYLAIIYLDDNGDTAVDCSAYLANDDDGFIGHDENGRIKGPRFAFDSTKNFVRNVIPHERIIRILPLADYNMKMLEMFG